MLAKLLFVTPTYANTESQQRCLEHISDTSMCASCLKLYTRKENKHAEKPVSESDCSIRCTQHVHTDHHAQPCHWKSSENKSQMSRMDQKHDAHLTSVSYMLLRPTPLPVLLQCKQHHTHKQHKGTFLQGSPWPLGSRKARGPLTGSPSSLLRGVPNTY